MFDYTTPTKQAYSVGATFCLRQIMSAASDDWTSTSTWLVQAKAWLCLLTHLSSTSDGHLTSDWRMQPWFHILRSLGCVRVYITGNNFAYQKRQHVRGRLCWWCNASVWINTVDKAASELIAKAESWSGMLLKCSLFIHVTGLMWFPVWGILTFGWI